MGLFRAGSHVWLDDQRGLCIWRSRDASEYMQDTSELSKHLDALEIPYTVAIETQMVRKSSTSGLTLQVARQNFGAITRFVPSFQKSIDAAEEAWAQAAPTGERSV